MADDESIERNSLWHLQERLKQERLFVNKEKSEISSLNIEIQSTCERLYHLSWITRQQWKVVQRVRASPEECSHVVNRLDSAHFVDASRHLGYLESKYWEFFKGLRENPSLVASTLAYADKINLDTSQLIRLLLNSLYGNCLLPQDENYVLMLMKHLIELKITGDESPEKFLQHKRNSFTSLFGILVESLFSAKLYLTAALHAPIMQVLSEDSLLQKRLPLKCTKFVENLKVKLYCFPQSLRWLMCQFANILSSHGMNDKEVRSMVLNLLFDCIVCPAIIRPEQFGITSDVQISEVASQNLQNIASCLQCLHSLYSSEDENARNLDMFSRIDPVCVTSFLDAILENQKDIQDFPNHKSLSGLCRNSVLITENELHALTSFLRMIEHSEDYKDIVNHKELEELLYPLPPQPEISPVEPITDPLTPPCPEHSIESPKMPKKKRAIKGKREDKTRKQSLGEGQAAEFEGKIIKQYNPLYVENKSEGFKKEFLQRMALMLKEGEDVLVISLGYSGIECPGLLSEEKVLGIKKPSKNEAETTKSFRPRSSSSQFSKHIFSDKSSAKKGKEGCNKEKSDEKEITTSHNDDKEHSSEVPQQIIAGSGNQDNNTDLPKSDTGEKTRTDLNDLLLRNTNSTTHATPDVLEGSTSNMQDSASVDLIDFGSESPEPLSPVSPEHFTENPLVEKQLPLAFENQAAGNRDSAISSGGSTRISSISTASTQSSGVEFTKECIFVDSGHGEILEENSNVQLPCLEPVDAPGNEFRKRSSVISDPERRDSKVSNRESTSSSTLTGYYGEGSNRDSQASFLSLDSEFPPRSGSSSTADDERESPAPREKKNSRAASLKRHLRNRKKSKGKDSFDGPDNVEKRSEKKEKGFFGKIRTARSKEKTKTSNARVYDELVEKTLDPFDITYRMAHPEMEEKTPKDIENVIKKYTDIARSTAEEEKLDAADGDDDDDKDEEDDDIVDEEEKFENSKRKLRLVLCQADFQNLPMVHSENRIPEKSVSGKSQCQELLTFLHVQLAEAINLQDRALSAQLHETIRSVKDLPPQSFARLVESLQEDYKARTPYLAYLVNAHQGLLATHSHLERLVERVERDKIICRTYFTTSCVKLFLESKEKGEISRFTHNFQSLPTPDEKCALLEEFLETLGDEMEKHPIWSGVSDEQFQDSLVAIERAIMSSIYISAFYPFGGVDQQIDSTFHEHVINLQKVIHPNHKAVRVPKMYRKEAPWESAQKELLAINAYKTPTDKLKCVKRCCVTIMNLLCLASETSVPGADEFVPALVYVVIHANPEGLLSTMQYVNNFYDKRLSGEEAYYWMQFCAAIAFIKTLRYGSS